MNVPASVAVILIIYQTGPGLCQVTPPRWPQQGYDPGLPNAHPYSARLGRNSKGEYALAWFPRVRHSKEPGYTGRPVISTANNTENRSGGYRQYQGDTIGTGDRSAITGSLPSAKPEAGSHGNFGDKRRQTCCI